MSDARITALDALGATPNDADILALVDDVAGTPVTKKITVANLLAGKADIDQTMYIGTTAVAINRTTAALTLAGLTLTTPDLGTPSAGTLTNCTFPTLNQSTTGSAATLTTPRAINGVDFNGSAAITVTAAADTLSATTLKSTVVSSSLTSVGALTSGSLGAGFTDVPIAQGGTGASTLAGASIPTYTSTNTFTNKRITDRVKTFTSDATPDIDSDDYDVVTITALAVAITDVNMTGTETNFQKLIFRILDDGTARAITWGSDFEDAGVALPTTTVISKLLTVGFIYDTVSSKWGCVAVANET